MEEEVQYKTDDLWFNLFYFIMKIYFLGSDKFSLFALNGLTKVVKKHDISVYTKENCHSLLEYCRTQDIAINNIFGNDKILNKSAF